MASKPKKTSGDESEAEADGGAAKPADKKKLPLKMIIIGAVAAVVILGGGGGAYFIMGKKHEAQAAAAAPVVKPAVYLDMPDVLVNLANTGADRTQYLKVKVTLELSDQIMMQQVQPMMPRVMDAFQTYLRELRATDLDGSAGLYRLKEELTRRVNAAISPNRVNAVLFKEIVVQ
ncbi:MAG: flagellar basal body-associated protein FliL [Pseudorhodoplanes sp.]